MPVEIVPFKAWMKEIHILVLPVLVLLTSTSPLAKEISQCYVLEPADDEL